MNIAYPMLHEERVAVASFIGKGPEPVLSPEAFCKDRRVAVSDSSKFNWNGWSPKLDNARFQPGDVAGLTLDQVKRLKLKWAYAFDGDITAFAQPTVIDGHVFVGSAGGDIQALRADSGCIEWTFQASGPVRSAIVAAPLGKNHALLFADLTGFYYAIEAETGRLLWKKRPEEHEATRLTGASIVHDGIVYVPAASWEETRSLNPEYQMLYFSRQHHRAPARQWRHRVEDLHDRRKAQADRQKLGWNSAVRSVRCGRLGNADAGPQAPPPLRHHRRQLLRAGESH